MIKQMDLWMCKNVFLPFKCSITRKENMLRNNNYLQIVGHDIPSNFTTRDTL